MRKYKIVRTVRIVSESIIEESPNSEKIQNGEKVEMMRKVK